MAQARGLMATLFVLILTQAIAQTPMAGEMTVATQAEIAVGQGTTELDHGGKDEDAFGATFLPRRLKRGMPDKVGGMDSWAFLILMYIIAALLITCCFLCFCFRAYLTDKATGGKTVALYYKVVHDKGVEVRDVPREDGKMNPRKMFDFDEIFRVQRLKPEEGGIEWLKLARRGMWVPAKKNGQVLCEKVQLSRATEGNNMAGAESNASGTG